MPNMQPSMVHGLPSAQSSETRHETHILPEGLTAHIGEVALQPLSTIVPVALSSQGAHSLTPRRVMHAGAAEAQPRSTPPEVVSEQA